MDFYGKEYACVVWRAEDVQSLRPSWPLERCEREMDCAERVVADMMTERGWDALSDMLPDENTEEEE